MHNSANKNDFEAQLTKQLGFVQRSCEMFDSGTIDEGIRIATALRVIFHSTNSSTSILAHLEKEDITLLTTVRNEVGQRDAFALIEMTWTVGEGNAFKSRPKLDTGITSRFISFTEWWQQEAIINSGKRITRRDLILSAANKDGGAHVDEFLDENYFKITEGMGMAIQLVSTEDRPLVETQPLREVHLASLRQIGFEVLNSPDLASGF